MVYNVVLVSAIRWSELAKCVHTPLLFWTSFPLDHHKTLSWVPCAIHQVLINYLFYTFKCIYVNPSLTWRVKSLRQALLWVLDRSPLRLCLSSWPDWKGAEECGSVHNRCLKRTCENWVLLTLTCASRTLPLQSDTVLSVSFRCGCWWLCHSQIWACRAWLHWQREEPVMSVCTWLSPDTCWSFWGSLQGRGLLACHHKNTWAPDKLILKLWKAKALPLSQPGGRDPCWPAGNPIVCQVTMNISLTGGSNPGPGEMRGK